MKQKLLFITATILLFSAQLKAQTSSVSGQVKDETGKPRTAATITLRNTADSSIIKTAVSDTAGTYKISALKTGRYFITASFTGTITPPAQFFDLKDDEQLVMRPLVLTVVNKSLQGVTV